MNDQIEQLIILFVQGCGILSFLTLIASSSILFIYFVDQVLLPSAKMVM